MVPLHRRLAARSTPVIKVSVSSLSDFRFTFSRLPGNEGHREEQNPLDLPVNNPNEPNNNDLPPEAEDNEDVPVNGPGGLGMMAGGMIRQRDFVDYLYMVMMTGFLVFIAYLTGSLGRLLIFTAGVMFMLL